jgi:hypothetical protein
LPNFGCPTLVAEQMVAQKLRASQWLRTYSLVTGHTDRHKRCHFFGHEFLIFIQFYHT